MGEHCGENSDVKVHYSTKAVHNGPTADSGICSFTDQSNRA